MEFLRPILVKIELICQQSAMKRPIGVIGVLSPAVGCWIGWLGADAVFRYDAQQFRVKRHSFLDLDFCFHYSRYTAYLMCVYDLEHFHYSLVTLPAWPWMFRLLMSGSLSVWPWMFITLSTGWQNDPSQKLLQGDRLPQNEEGLTLSWSWSPCWGWPARIFMGHCSQPLPPDFLLGPCWAIIVKMRYSSCQHRLSTDFRNVVITLEWDSLLYLELLFSDSHPWSWTL